MRLFHSSCFDLDIIRPSVNYTATGVLGDFVFAQDNIMIANAYAFKNPNVYSIGTLSNIPYLLAHDENEFLSLLLSHNGKPGGYIYEVPPENFLRIGHEYVSKLPIVPIKKSFVSIEDAVCHGLKVLYFREMPDYETLRLAITSNRSTLTCNPSVDIRGISEQGAQHHARPRAPRISSYLAP